MEGCDGLGVEVWAGGWSGEGGCGNGGGEELCEVGDALNSGEVEVAPGADVTNVPPEVGIVDAVGAYGAAD